jgi:hypothetical protein
VDQGAVLGLITRAISERMAERFEECFDKYEHLQPRAVLPWKKGQAQRGKPARAISNAATQLASTNFRFMLNSTRPKLDCAKRATRGRGHLNQGRNPSHLSRRRGG